MPAPDRDFLNWVVTSSLAVRIASKLRPEDDFIFHLMEIVVLTDRTLLPTQHLMNGGPRAWLTPKGTSRPLIVSLAFFELIYAADSGT